MMSFLQIVFIKSVFCSLFRVKPCTLHDAIFNSASLWCYLSSSRTGRPLIYHYYFQAPVKKYMMFCSFNFPHP